MTRTTVSTEADQHLLNGFVPFPHDRAERYREAGYWARKENHSFVTRADVDAAVAHKRHRSNLAEHWIQDEIKEGTLMVDLDGDVVGQVNGLSVHQLGDYAFGRPTRITARTYVGTKGVIDVQREAELAGNIHSKGVLTLSGYLAGKFAGLQEGGAKSLLGLLGPVVMGLIGKQALAAGFDFRRPLACRFARRRGDGPRGHGDRGCKRANGL